MRDSSSQKAYTREPPDRDLVNKHFKHSETLTFSFEDEVLLCFSHDDSLLFSVQIENYMSRKFMWI